MALSKTPWCRDGHGGVVLGAGESPEAPGVRSIEGEAGVVDDSTPWAVMTAPEGAVARTFAVLELLALAREPMRLSAIGLQLGLQKSTVHRILVTLIGLGYVQQDRETSCYRAGLRMWELASALIGQHPVRRAGVAVLQRLHEATGETVNLTIMSGDDVLYLDKLTAPQSILISSHAGSRATAAATASGKAMLAHDPGAAAIIRRSLPRMCEKREVSFDALMEELSAVRRTGYATARWGAGVLSFGAPIRRRDGRAVAAMSVSAPESRLNPAKCASIIEQLLAACAAVAERVTQP